MLGLVEWVQNIYIIRKICNIQKLFLFFFDKSGLNESSLNRTKNPYSPQSLLLLQLLKNRFSRSWILGFNPSRNQMEGICKYLCSCRLWKCYTVLIVLIWYMIYNSSKTCKCNFRYPAAFLACTSISYIPAGNYIFKVNNRNTRTSGVKYVQSQQ